jgi:hypothetical protein
MSGLKRLLGVQLPSRQPSGELTGRQHIPAADTDDYQVVAMRRHHRPSLALT